MTNYEMDNTVGDGSCFVVGRHGRMGAIKGVILLEVSILIECRAMP